MEGEDYVRENRLYINSGERLLYAGTTFSKIQEEKKALVINRDLARIPVDQIRPPSSVLDLTPPYFHQSGITVLRLFPKSLTLIRKNARKKCLHFACKTVLEFPILPYFAQRG